MRLTETIRREYFAQKKKCQAEQAKLARLETEYFAAVDSDYKAIWRGNVGGIAGA